MYVVPVPPGGVYVLDDVQLLLPGPGGPAQTPSGQTEAEDPREDRTPYLRPAPERRLHRDHQEGWVWWDRWGCVMESPVKIRFSFGVGFSFFLFLCLHFPLSLSPPSFLFTLTQTHILLFPHFFKTWLSVPPIGWKNAQLAQQLEERERRIKNHLDIASKG